MSKLHTASKLVNFYNCRYLTYLEELGQGNPDEKITISDESRYVIERGNRHEKNYLDYLQYVAKKEIINIQELTEGKSSKQAFEITKKILTEERPDVIFQATLMNSQWLGKADFLCKNPKTGYYDIVDTKVAKHPKPTHLLQIGLYYELLQQISQETKTPISQQLILVSPGSDFYQQDKPFTEHHYQYKHICHYLNNIKRDYLNFLEQDPKSIQISPERNSLCQFCNWNQHCQKIWHDRKDLYLIPTMNSAHRYTLIQDNLNNLDALAIYKYKDELQLNVDYFIHYQNMAKVYLKSLEKNSPQYAFNKNYIEDIGYMRLPQVSERDLYVDIVDDPMKGDHPIRMICVRYSENFKADHKRFIATDFDEELSMFQNFFDFIEQWITEPNDIKSVSDDSKDSTKIHYKIIGKVYYYNDRFLKALIQLAERQKIDMDKLDLFKKHAFIDLKQLAQECLYISQPSYSLYDLQTYVANHLSPLEHNGKLLQAYEEFLQTADAQILKSIYDELERHVEVIEAIHCWILQGRPNYEVEAKPQRLRKKSLEETAEQLDYKRFYKVFESEFRVLADLLNFYEREAIPSELKANQRLLASKIELIRDSECLADLTLSESKPMKTNPQEKMYIYDFPKQDSRIKNGSKDYLNLETGQPVGVVAKIDLQKQKIAIISRNELPNQLTLIPENKVYTGILEEAIHRYAQYQAQLKTNTDITDHTKYQAITDILKKNFPRIKTIPYGEKISHLDQITDNTERSRHIVTTIANLDHSYIVIQGAPGAGKTFVASQIINNLILRGYRIGVTSNSHKAINNLLAGIEKRAKDLLNDGKIKEIKIKGVKVSSERDSDTLFNGDFIRDELKAKDVMPHLNHYNLFAGTAWLFARERFEQQPIDYLFIDEAGQVSLAGLIAMGTATKNIILLGDQMQLAQPIQGEHPNDAGKSALEYLLEDEAVISNHKGFFLGQTFRMHPDITDFISHAVYDGCLTHNPRTELQTLILDDDLKQTLNYRETGIVFLPIEHQDCTQHSIQEVEFIQELYAKLLKQSYRDQQGEIQPITNDNIVIVTPYNLQVNLIKAYLPDAKVGTVDKFQGQEAEIVIISMATSNGELTADFDFLYSKNRLNVAISRAKCLAILIANPDLKLAKCDSTDQLELVNTLCWLMEK